MWALSLIRRGDGCPWLAIVQTASDEVVGPEVRDALNVLKPFEDQSIYEVIMSIHAILANGRKILKIYMLNQVMMTTCCLSLLPIPNPRCNSLTLSLETTNYRDLNQRNYNYHTVLFRRGSVELG